MIQLVSSAKGTPLADGIYHPAMFNDRLSGG